MVLQPKNPTMSALGRASSLSLGSIAFGSLIVTLLEILQMVLRAVQNNANQDGNGEWSFIVHSPLLMTNSAAGVEACLACCANCFVGIIENLVAYFNRLIQTSYLYGLAFTPVVGTRTSRLRYMANHTSSLPRIRGDCSRIAVGDFWGQYLSFSDH